MGYRSYHEDLLAPAAIKELRIDLTSRCNLRCVYCHVSRVGYIGEDMGSENLRRAVSVSRSLMRYHDLRMVSVNGGGETTFLDGWEKICENLLDAGAPLGITTNLAKEYSQAELGVLARIPRIAISIDTSDRALLRRLRRKVDVRQVVTNVALIRAASVRWNYRPPQFSFLSGLYDKNALSVEDLARLAISLQVRRVRFWDLKKYPLENMDVTDDERVTPLRELPNEELQPRIVCILNAIALLRRHGVDVGDCPHFVSSLAARVGISV